MKIDLTPQMLAVIDHLLRKAPYEMAAPVINEINRQMKLQVDNSRGEAASNPTGDD